MPNSGPFCIYVFAVRWRDKASVSTWVPVNIYETPAGLATICEGSSASSYSIGMKQLWVPISTKASSRRDEGGSRSGAGNELGEEQRDARCNGLLLKG